MEKITFEEIKYLEKKDIPKVITLLTDSFSEDPCLKYLLNSEVYNPEKAKYIHKYTINIGLLYGMVLKIGKEIDGISIWLPPGRINTTTWMFLRAGGMSLKKNIDKNIIERFKDYGEYASSIHHKYINLPHWYLLSIAIEKNQQGKGYANRLLNPVLNYFDRNKLPCYLETHNSRNIPIYEKYGFKVMEIGELPHSNKKHWGMLRIPQLITEQYKMQ